MAFLGTKQWLDAAEEGRPLYGSLPSMLNHEEWSLLYHLTRTCYLGYGEVVDLGAFLGGSTVRLAKGLRDRGIRDRVMHSYDRFVTDDFLVTWIPGLLAQGRFRHLYDANVAPFADLIEVHDGDILSQPWLGRPIEILFVDVAKTWQINEHLVRSFFPSLIPGVSLVVQQDYLHEWLPWLHVTMESFADHFDYVTDTRNNSVVFSYERRIPTDRLLGFDWMKMGMDAKVALIDRAIARFADERQASYIREARNVLLKGKPDRMVT